jgi:DNA-binding transcriptional MerR regulator/effector-binding domain-containing protein
MVMATTKQEYFTIGEAAYACGITPRTLRHYEQKGLLKPHNVNESTGYRYYDARDLQDILLVLLLRDAGMSIEEVERYIHEAIAPQEQLDLLQKQLASVQSSIDLLKTHCTKSGELHPRRVRLPERLCICKEVVASDVASFIPIYQSCAADIIRMGWALSREYLSFCEYPAETFSENKLDLNDFPVKICVPVEVDLKTGGQIPEIIEIFSEQDAVSVDYRGSYEEMSKAYEAIYDYMAEHDLEQNGKPQEIYINSLNGTFSEDECLTRIMIPAREK